MRVRLSQCWDSEGRGYVCHCVGIVEGEGVCPGDGTVKSEGKCEGVSL